MKPIRPDELKLELYHDMFMYSLDKLIQQCYNGKRVYIWCGDIGRQLDMDHSSDVGDFYRMLSHDAFDGFLNHYRPYWNISYKMPWWSDSYRVIMTPKEDYDYPEKT